MSTQNLETIDHASLHLVSGGQQGQPAQPAPVPPNEFRPPSGNVVQQAGQMIDNAAQGWNGAAKAGASWYERLGNATIGFFGLSGGFGPNGQPRP